MHGYICLYNGKQVEIRTDKGTYAAQQLALPEFAKLFPRRKVKDYDITVHLAELPDGSQYTQTITN